MKCYRDGGCGPYEMRSCNECPASKEDYMHRAYDQIKKNVEESWPEWKIKLANDALMTSKHAKKLQTGKRGVNEKKVP